MKPRALLALSMVVFGTIGLFVRLIPLKSHEIALYRAVLAGLVIFLFQKAKGRPPGIGRYRAALPRLLLSGVMMGLNWVFLFEAYRHTTVAIATICYYMAALLVTVLSPLIFKEKSSPFQLLCFALSLLGLVLMLLQPGAGAPADHRLGILFGLLAAILYAGVIIMNKLIPGVPGTERTLIQFLGAVGVLLPYTLASGPLLVGQIDLVGLLLMLAVGIFHTGITYCWYFEAVRQLEGRQIALMSFLDPLVAVLLSALTLTEALSPLQMLGGLMVVLFTYLSERGQSRQPEPEPS